MTTPTIGAFHLDMRTDFPLLYVYPTISHWWSSTLCAPLQIADCTGRFPQLSICSWPIPKHVMHTELGAASQNFCTTLTRLPNRSPDTHNFFASTSPLTVITIAEPRLPLAICASLSQFSLINQRGRVLSCMPVNDSNSCFNSSSFPSPKYLSRGIPYLFNRCQCSNISTPTTAWSTDFAVRISKFDSRRSNTLALACSVSRADIASDGAYLTQINRVCGFSPAFCKASFNTSIKSASDFYSSTSLGKRILFFWSSILAFGLVTWFQLLYIPFVQGFFWVFGVWDAATDA